MVFATSPYDQPWWRKFSLVWRAPRRGEWFSRWLVASLSVAVLLPPIMLWFEPLLLPYAAGLLAFAVGIGIWWQWLGREHLAAWISGALTVSMFWASSFVFWLFLENPLYRVVWLLLLGLFSWWYLTEWRRSRQKLFIGEPLVPSAPTLALGFLTAFTLGVSAESFLVYLNVSLGWLWLLFYTPLVVSFVTLTQLSGWSLVKHAAYPLTAAVLLAQVFAVVTWWPTSFYVAGFTLALSYLVVALVVRQEAQGFINRRSFSRELGLLLGCLAVVLLLARWV